MKVSLNYWHKEEILSKADELIIPFDKSKDIWEIVEKFPNKDLVIDLPKGLTLDYHIIAACKQKMENGQIYIRLHELNAILAISKCKEYKLNFFYSEPIKTFYDLYSVKKLGVSYVYVDAPLFFQMDEVKKVGIPLRIIPNRCYVQGDIPRENGLHGCWIRPEKIDLYEKYAEILEFFTIDKKQEFALYQIYVEHKSWSGDMGTIYQGFNLHMDNQLVYEGLDEIRLNCGQNCETTKPKCLLCNKVKRFEKIGREWANEAIKRQEQENVN